MLLDAAVVLGCCVEAQAAEDCHLQEASVLDSGFSFEQLADVVNVAGQQVGEAGGDRVVSAAVGAEVNGEEATNTAGIQSDDGSVFRSEDVLCLWEGESLWASQSGVVEIEEVGDVGGSVDGLHLASKTGVGVMREVKG